MNLFSLLQTLRCSGESRIPIRWICTGWIPSGLVNDLCKMIWSPVALYQTTICERCTKEHNRLFEGFNNYRYHWDLFYYSLYSIYCLPHLQNSEKHLKNCSLRYNFFHAAFRCCSIRLILTQWFVCSSDVQCCMLLKDSVFVLWINNFKCSLKTSVDLVLATEHLKL